MEETVAPHSFYYRGWQWRYKIGLTFIGVVGVPVRSKLIELSFAYESQIELSFAYESRVDTHNLLRVRAELKRQINQRWPQLPSADPSPSPDTVASSP